MPRLPILSSSAAYQYDSEHPGTDLGEVLAQTRSRYARSRDPNEHWWRFGRLTVDITGAIRRRLQEPTQRRAIPGRRFRATHSWWAAQRRIKQDQQHDATDADPRPANQHGHNYQTPPLPLAEPPPALPHTVNTCDGVHRRHFVPIHDSSAESPLTVVHVSALPFRCCSTHRRV